MKLRRECSLFRSAPQFVVVIQSYGEKYGVPDDCLVRVSVKNKIRNPPQSLHRHTGLNEDLRRWVVDNADDGVMEEVANVLSDAVSGVFMSKFNDIGICMKEACWASFVCHHMNIPKRATLLICDYLFKSSCCDDVVVVVGVGCVAGRHRSVAVVEHIIKQRLLKLTSCPLPLLTLQSRHRDVNRHKDKKNKGKKKRGDDRTRVTKQRASKFDSDDE